MNNATFEIAKVALTRFSNIKRILMYRVGK
jgi:hypothetical protein